MIQPTAQSITKSSERPQSGRKVLSLPALSVAKSSTPQRERVTFQNESFSSVLGEIQPLWKRHWDAVAIEKDKIPLEPNIPQYLAIERSLRLDVVTARQSDELIGYCFTVIYPEMLHYRGSRQAVIDIFYIDPSGHEMALVALYRHMFNRVKINMSQRKIQKLQVSIKLKHDLGPLMESFGFTPFERTYYQMLD